MTQDIKQLNELLTTFTTLVSSLRAENLRLNAESHRANNLEKELSHTRQLLEDAQNKQAVSRRNRDLESKNYALTIELQKSNNELYNARRMLEENARLKLEINELNERITKLSSETSTLRSRLDDDDKEQTIILLDEWSCSIAERLGVPRIDGRPRGQFLSSITDAIRKLLARRV